jgi:ABC-type transporter Mla maintaining outer membrane lipid asymmetry ATPase subunit MlaF
VADRMVMLHQGTVRLEGDPSAFRGSSDPVVERFLKGQANPEELAEIHREHAIPTASGRSA